MGYVSNNDKGLNSLFLNNSVFRLVAIDHNIIMRYFSQQKKQKSLNVYITSTAFGLSLFGWKLKK